MGTATLPAMATETSPYGSASVIAFVNEKGGVAKTTSCVNLAAALARRDQRVLCIDLDPQANTTTAFGVSAQQAIDRESHCLLPMSHFPLERAVVPTRVPNLDLIPGSGRLADCAKQLVTEVGREGRLRSKLRDFYRSVLTDKYDALLIDCPPSLDLLTINALTAATDMVVPVTTRFYALKGMALLGDLVATLHEQVGASVRLLGILVTVFDSRAALDRTIYSLLREKVERDHGDYVFSTVIPRGVVASEAETGGVPLILRESEARVAEAYQRLADEMIARLRNGTAAVCAPTFDRSGGSDVRTTALAAEPPRADRKEYPRKSDWLRAQFLPEVESLDLSGLLAGNGGLAVSAERFRRSVVLATPSRMTEVVLRANGYQQQGDHARALICYQELADMDPANADFRFRLGKSMVHVGLLDDAVQSLARAKELGHEGAGAELQKLGRNGHHQRRPGGLLRFWRQLPRPFRRRASGEVPAASSPEPAVPQDPEDDHSRREESISLRARPLLGGLLLREGLVTEAELKDALKTQKDTGKRLGEILLEMGAISHDELDRVLALQQPSPPSQDEG